MTLLIAWVVFFGPRIGTGARRLLLLRPGPEGERDEAVQFAQFERLVQIAGRALDQRFGLPGVPATTHHENWRLHAKVADALQEVERSEERRVGKECRSRWSPDH